LIMRVIKAK